MTRLRAVAPLIACGALIGMLVSAVVTWLQLGPAPDFLAHWLRAAALSLAVMLPSAALVIGPLMSFVVQPWVQPRLARVGGQAAGAAA
jgi:hypothetical protein